MKNIRHSLQILLAAGCSLFVSACATQKPLDARFIVQTPEEIAPVLSKTAADAQLAKLQPGKIYLSSKLAGVFSVRVMDCVENEQGLFVARVLAKTETMDYLTYTFGGEKPLEMCYRFVWFDANGKLDKACKSPVQMRESMPGDPVRFTSIATAESGKKFAVCIRLMNEGDTEAEKAEAKAKETEAKDKKSEAKPAASAAKPAAVKEEKKK